MLESRRAMLERREETQPWRAVEVLLSMLMRSLLASVVWFSYAMSNALQKRVKTTRISKHRMRRQYLGPA